MKHEVERALVAASMCKQAKAARSRSSSSVVAVPPSRQRDRPTRCQPSRRLAQVTLAAALMNPAEEHGVGTALLEALRPHDSAYPGARGKVISAAYGRLKSLS